MKGTSDIYTYLVIFRKQVPVHEHMYMFVYICVLLYVYTFTLYADGKTKISSQCLVKFMFTVPGVTCFLSEKICQDPLEKFFGCQRQRGGVNANPTAQEFCTNTHALRVVNSFCQNVSRGNCRGRKVGKIDMEKENMPLPKRRKCHI